MDYRFGKTYRLLKTEDFSSVFALRRQIRGTTLTISFSGNNGLAHPRLGLVVAKKTAKRANKRNYMKRVIREWFRQHRHTLPPVDLVVRVGTAFGRGDAHGIWRQLDEQSRKIRFRQP